MPDQINTEYQIPTFAEEQVSRVNQESVLIDQNREEINKIYSIVGKAGVDSVIVMTGSETICDLSKELYRKAKDLETSRAEKLSELNKAA